MCQLTVEELINNLETYDAEHCVSIKMVREKQYLEIWEAGTGCTVGTIQIPE